MGYVVTIGIGIDTAPTEYTGKDELQWGRFIFDVRTPTSSDVVASSGAAAFHWTMANQYVYFGSKAFHSDWEFDVGFRIHNDDVQSQCYIWYIDAYSISGSGF